MKNKTLIRNIEDKMDSVSLLFSSNTVSEMNIIIDKKIKELILIKDSILLYKLFFNEVITKALFLDFTDKNGCKLINNHLDEIAVYLDFLIEDLNIYSHKNKLEYKMFTLNKKPPIISNELFLFKKVENARISMLNKLAFKNFEDLKNEIVVGLNNDVARGGKLLEHGFFDMPANWVKAFMSNKYLSWGGYYSKQKDFMHFELRQDHLKLGASQGYSAKLLYKIYPLVKLKEQLESLGIIVEWNDKVKKDYLKIIKD